MSGFTVLVGPLARVAALPIATCGRCITINFPSLGVSMRHAHTFEFLPCPVVDQEGFFALLGAGLAERFPDWMVRPTQFVVRPPSW